MKTLRHTCAASILTLALAVSVLAGEIHCPGVASTGTTTTDTTTNTATTEITTTVILMAVTTSVS